jgi:hypothetical protein
MLKEKNWQKKHVFFKKTNELKSTNQTLDASHECHRI